MTTRQKYLAQYLNEVVVERELVSVSDEELHVVFECIVNDLHDLIEAAYLLPEDEPIFVGH